MRGLSIYAAEHKGPGEINPHHAFLVLIDETNPRDKPLEEIHFYITKGAFPGRPDEKYFYVEIKAGQHSISELSLGGHIGGAEDIIRQEWAKACDYARRFDLRAIGTRSIMQPDSYNCRTGVIGTLRHLGLEFYTVVRAPDTNSGTQADLDTLLRLEV